MVGFPGETEDDHAETLSLVDEVGFLAGSCVPLVPATGNARISTRRPSGRRRRRAGAAPRCVARRSAPGQHSLAAACGRVHEVAWDAVEEQGAHGLTAGYHEITVEDVAGLRQGGLDLVRADDVLGDRLRGTLLRS